jgi:hypothetical protein
MNKQTKQQRWDAAVAAAMTALDELVEMQQDYQQIYENMNDSLQQTPYGQKLSEMENLDIQSLRDGLDELDGFELPKGFGRD